MWLLAPFPFLVHSLGMLLDEAWFHRRRGLPAWERWGHPLDTLTVLACYGMALASPPSRAAFLGYIALAALSCLFVTKDEWIHARHCSGGEMWLHAFLFVLHPILLGIAGVWRFAGMQEAAASGGRSFFGLFLAGQTAVTALFLGYQLFYWNGPWKPALPPAR